MVAFISSIIADINDPYPNYSWWSIVYMLFVILGVVFAVGCDCVPNYQVAIVGLLSAGLVFTTSSVNALIYNSDPAKEAAAAGFILLSMVSVSTSSLPEHPYLLLIMADCLDFLLWLITHHLSPTNHRFFRSAQGRRCESC